MYLCLFLCHRNSNESRSRSGTKLKSRQVVSQLPNGLSLMFVGCRNIILDELVDWFRICSCLACCGWIAFRFITIPLSCSSRQLNSSSGLELVQEVTCRSRPCVVLPLLGDRCEPLSRHHGNRDVANSRFVYHAMSSHTCCRTESESTRVCDG